jgi:hypothetical protein
MAKTSIPSERAALILATARLHLALDELSAENTGRALADAVAMWIGGHLVGAKEDTAALRADLLDHHIATVRRLIPVCAKQIGLPW